MATGNRRNLVGIDLGTTISVIAHVESHGAVSTLPNSDGEPLTASAVYIDGTNVIVGRVAKEAAAHTPHKVATFVKRDMGRPQYSREVDGRVFRPETLSAMILRKMKQDAERRIGPIRQAVITVPAFFDDARRKATEDAGRIAGFESVEILNEPTAAALSYCLESQLNNEAAMVQPQFHGGRLTVLVYDLGGGTFDATTVVLESDRIDTLATDGAVKLGGKDWDDRIVEHVTAAFMHAHNIDIPPERRHAIANKAETAKKLLSQLSVSEIEHFDHDRQLRLTLTREQFEEMTRDLLAQTEVVTNLIVKQSRLRGSDQPLSWTDIDRVLLVGGSTRMPMVSQMLRRVTGKEPDRSLDPDQVVARGAAVFANIIAARGGQKLDLDDNVAAKLDEIGVVDVNSHSLGIEAYNRRTSKPINAIVIPKNHPLPCAKSRVFPLKEQGMRTVRVRVLEGEAPEPDANIQLGECLVTGLPPDLPAKSPVQVRLSCETNGRVHVMAMDMTSGNFAHAEIKRNAGLTDADIRREAALLASLQIQ
jgi:molecular chaperone DnaK